MNDQALSSGADVRQRLSSLVNRERMLDLLTEAAPTPAVQTHVAQPAPVASAPPSPLPLAQRPLADVVITYNEVSTHHGTGILLRNLLGSCPNLVSIRTNNTYGGDQTLGTLRYSLNGDEPARDGLFRAVAEWTQAWVPRNILCVPYSSTELLTAIALKEMYGARFCLYVMDDQNAVGNHIPDGVMAEAIEKADLRLVISTEMMAAYQEKWNKKFYVFPPLVRENLIAGSAAAQPAPADKAILIGNIWSDEWLTRLANTVRGSGVHVDWYTNNLNAPWLRMKVDDLRADGIHVQAPLPEPAVAETLPRYGFALVPTGTLGPEDDRKSIAALSLPSRVPFILATSRLPILVLGNSETAVARFVSGEGVGVVAGYDRAAFSAAVQALSGGPAREEMVRRAGEVGPRFSDAGALGWLWESLRLGYAADDRFSFLEKIPPGKPLHYVEEPVKADIWRGFHVDYRCVRRLIRHGFVPDFVVDIGASTGVWSHSVSSLLPGAKFYLVEPLVEAYPPEAIHYQIEVHPNFHLIRAAVADQPGTAKFTVSRDLYNSSLIQLSEYAEESKRVDVRIVTLDQLDKEFGFEGRGLVKIDVQFGEHLVYRGGRKTIDEKVDAILVELTLARVHPDVMTLGEWIQLMDGAGFEYFEDGGEWRDPVTGRLQQKDLLFLRRSRLEGGTRA